MPEITYGKKGVAFPKGFVTNGLAVGLKKNGKRDLGLVFSTLPATAAGTFTSNQFIAHPIAYSQKMVKTYGAARAILSNSGNANACCGKFGDETVKATVQALSLSLNIKPKEILVFSTGKIGGKLPYEKITSNLPSLVEGLSEKNDLIFSESILTTDTKMKCKSAEFKVSGKTVRIGCSAKGAGMIEPGMATMLCYITCDASIPNRLLQKTLSEAVNLSFNRITVDGDMSTNDSVVILANGASGVSIRSEKDPGYKAFRESLIDICQTIARYIVEDGEGATKIMKVHVRGAKTEEDAKAVCRSIGNSMLFKCSLFGETPDWGRILSSIGATRAKLNMKKFYATLQGITFFQKGEPDFNARDKIAPLMKKREIEVTVFLGTGTREHYVWASDLTYEYVKINVV